MAETQSESVKFVFFRVKDNYFGINILYVKEIIRYEKITFLNTSEKYLKGVINLRGKIVPIVDLRIKFNFEELEYNDRTIFIILNMTENIEENLIGFSVDEIFDVIEYKKEDIKVTPAVAKQKNQNNHIEGIVQYNNNIATILNIKSIIKTKYTISL